MKTRIVAMLVCLALMVGGCALLCKFNIPQAQSKVDAVLHQIQIDYAFWVSLIGKDPGALQYIVLADQALAMLGPVAESLQSRLCPPKVIEDAALAKAAEALAAKPTK